MGNRPPRLSSRTVTLRGDGLPQILGQVALTVARVQGTEGLNSLFTYTVDAKTLDAQHRLSGPAANLDLAAMQGKELTLELELDGTGTGLAGHLGAGTREITGIVTRVEGPMAEGRHFVYRLTLRPWLFLATLTSDFKIFQQKTVVEILQNLLADYSFPVESRLDVARYPTREYQVQSGETDFAFFERLTQEWGISYGFEHSGGHHRLVLTDGNGAFHRFASPAYHTLTWRPSSDRADAEHLYDFHVQDRLVSGKWTSTDYDFGKPRADLSVATHDPRDTAHAEGEIYEYPGDHAQPATGNDPWREGDMLARIRMEAIRQHGSRVHGAGNVRAVVPGCTFTLQGFAQTAANREYVVFGTTLALEDVAEASGQGQQWRCEVEFQAQSTAEIFRPERTRPKPRVHGPQTATVVGPEKEQVWVDAFGRIKIQLHWDRIGRRDANSFCWVRVSQAWQGDEFGASHLPRIGQEVIVGFTHGDPDCPIITGRMPNRVNLPAWVLPSQHALSGFRSKELFGERHNTFVQDDTQGEIQTQLGSDHQASMLSLGYLVRIPDADGRRDKRGEGFELRTDGHGAIRGGSGLLLTAEIRPEAVSYHKDISETAQRLANGQALQQALGEAADHQRAQDGQQAGVADALKTQNDTLKGNGEQGEFAAPHLVLASPAGIAATAAEDIHLHSARHTALTTGQHLSVATGKSLMASATEKIALFARKAGLRFFAARGKIEIQAQSDDIEVIAQKVLRLISAQERIEITAAKEILVNGNGSYIRINTEGIEHGTPGTWKAHASSHGMPGPKSIGQAMPLLPQGEAKVAEHFVLAELGTGLTLPDQPYRITLDDGRVIAGVTNARGETELATAAVAQVARLEFLSASEPGKVLTVHEPMLTLAAQHAAVAAPNPERRSTQVGGKTAEKAGREPTSENKQPMLATCDPHNYGLRVCEIAIDPATGKPGESSRPLRKDVVYTVAKIYTAAIKPVLQGIDWAAMTWPLSIRQMDTFVSRVQPLVETALQSGAFGLPRGLAGATDEAGAMPAIKIITDEQLKALNLVATANAGFLRQSWQIAVTPKTIDALCSARDPASWDIAQKMLADVLYHEGRHCQQEFWMAALMQQFPQDYARVPHMQEFYGEFFHKNVFKLAAKQPIPKDALVLRGLHRMLVGHYYWMLAGLREGRLAYKARNPGVPLFGDAFYDAELQAARQFAYDLLQTVGAGGVSINVDTMVNHDTGYRAQLHEDDAFICGEAVQSYWDSRDDTPLLRNPGTCTREFSDAAG
ncbi:type VI secretion system Vgr family protein, partial [Cupriavidus basilensis]|uniref:type VI secretion system Vgr family protein n=1 Tax=Cupriavidus basilensis TaxID=68895 RepID=UPI00284A496D